MPQIRKRCEHTVSPIPSFRAQARNLFRWRSRRNGRASENGKHGTPYASRSRRFIRAGKSERLTKKRPRLCLGGRYEKMLLTHSCLFRCVSQPPPLRGTSFQRKEGEACPSTKAFPAWDGSDARIPFPPYRHSERKREIFFVCGHEETGEHRKTGNTVLHTLRDHVVLFEH